jgi:hypothetical protein
MRLHEWFQGLLDHGRGKALGDRGHPEQTLAPLFLGEGDHLHRGREITPRGQPSPEFVEVVFQPRVNRCARLSLSSCSAVLGFPLLLGFPDGLLGNTNRLC